MMIGLGALSKKKVYKVCKALNLPKGKHGYIIPEKMKKPYFPDSRGFFRKDRLHVYIHVLNAITDELLIIPSLIGTDEQHIRTAVRELKKTEAIVLMDGAEDDLDYQSFMIGMKYSDWTLHSVKEKMKLISDFLTIAKEAKAVVA